MQKIVVVVGAHALGKTTLCKSVEAQVDPRRLFVLYGDQGEGKLKGTLEHKIGNLTAILDTEKRHILIEGARAIGGLHDLLVTRCYQNLVFIVILASADRMVQGIKARQTRNGREFTTEQEQYWKDHADYEGKRRHLNKMVQLAGKYPDLIRQVELRVQYLRKPFPDFSELDTHRDYLINLFNREEPW